MDIELKNAWAGAKELARIASNPSSLTQITRYLVSTAIRSENGIYDTEKSLGNGRQTLVMVPGFGCDGASLNNLGQELEVEGYNVVAPDTLPRGLSAMFTSMTPAHKAEKTAEFLGRFVGDMNEDSDVHLVGHSNGGLISLLALRHLEERAADIYERIKSVITMASPVRPHPNYHLASTPFLASLVPGSRHLHPNAPLYGRIESQFSKLSLCIASNEDELFPPEMQYVPDSPMAMTSLSHWDYMLAGPQLRSLAGLISKAISINAVDKE